MRRIGVLMHLAADDAEGQRRIGVFLQGLQEAGWAVGCNVDIDVRWAAGDADRFRSYAVELIALMRNVVLASATPSVTAMQQQPTLPVVGFLYAGSPETSAHLVAAFRQGLSETGYVEGHDLPHLNRD